MISELYRKNDNSNKYLDAGTKLAVVAAGVISVCVGTYAISRAVHQIRNPSQRTEQFIPNKLELIEEK